MQQLSSLSTLSVYPVPASDNVTLRLDVARESSFDVRIKDPAGRDMGRHTAFGDLGPGSYHRQISVANLSPGLYIIECLTDTGPLYTKVIVQH